MRHESMPDSVRVKRARGVSRFGVSSSFRVQDRWGSSRPDRRDRLVSCVVTCETVTDEGSFAALAGSWDGLVRAMSRPSPFMLHGWIEEWWRHFGPGRELAVHIARRDGPLVGAIP